MCTHNYSSLRLHKIINQNGRLIKDSFIEYQINEGKISGFSIHPSNEYAIIISDAGYFFVYSLIVPELIGKIVIDSNPWGCKIDSSGLYLMTSSLGSTLANPKETERNIGNLKHIIFYI